jgi:hypothetical protein
MKQEILSTGNDSFRPVFYVLKKGIWTVVMTEELERIPGK